MIFVNYTDIFLNKLAGIENIATEAAKIHNHVRTGDEEKDRVRWVQIQYNPILL